MGAIYQKQPQKWHLTQVGGVQVCSFHITDNLTCTSGIEIIMAFKQIYTNIAKDDNGDNDNTKDDDINVDKDDNDDDEKRMC